MQRLICLFAAATALSACGRDQENAIDRQAATPPAAAPAAPASPPLALPATAAPRLTSDGFGPLRIGMTRAEVVSALGEDSEPNAVGGADPAACDQFRPLRAPDGVLVMVENGRLTRISLIRGSAVQTDRGLKLGDTELDVRATYGAGLVVEPHKYVTEGQAKYLTAWAIPGQRGVRYETDGEGVVRSIHAGDNTIQYVEGCS